MTTIRTNWSYSNMRKDSLFLLTFCLMLGVALPRLGAQGIRFSGKSFEKLLEKATKEDKLIFVDAYTTWCGPCKWMDNNVFTDKEVGAFFNHQFINTKIDMEEGAGIEFAEIYDVQVYPTLLFINGNGELVHKQHGAAGVEGLLLLGQNALNPDHRIGEMLQEYEAGNRESDFLYAYASRLMDCGADASEVTEQYFLSLSNDELATTENLQLFRMTGPTIFDESFKRYAALYSQELHESLEKSLDSLYLETAMMAAKKAVYHDDSIYLRQVLVQIDDLNLPVSDQVVLYTNMREAWGTGHYRSFLKYADAYYRNYVWDDWNALNTMAWEIYEDSYAAQDYLQFGLDLAIRSIELDENYYNCDTRAALLHKMGLHEQAHVWIDKALKHAKSIGFQPEESIQLKKSIEKAIGR